MITILIDQSKNNTALAKSISILFFLFFYHGHCPVQKIEMTNFIQQGHIKLIEFNSKVILNITKYLYFE